MHRTLINKSGALIGMAAGSLTENNLNVAVNAQHRPGITADAFGAHIFYSTGNNLYRAPLTGWTRGTPATMNAGSFNFSQGALRPISMTELACFRLEDGGIRPHLAIWSGSWSLASSPNRRFISSSRVMSVGELEFTAAARLGSKTYFYATVDGSVVGMYYDHAISDWSGVFEAIPADLAQFQVINARVINNRIWLAGQFSRKDELANGITYWLAAESIDGRHFSLHPQSLLSASSERFWLDTSGGYVYGANTNRIERGILAGSETLDLAQADLTQFSDTGGFGESAALLGVANGDERFDGHPLLKRGNRVEVYAGYGAEEVEYNTYLITGIDEIWVDGRRELILKLVHEGLERIASFGHPYALEIANQSAHHDVLEDLKGFYAAPLTGIVRSACYVDFWDCEPHDLQSESISGLEILWNGGPGVTRQTGAHKGGVQTADLKEKLGLLTYPMVFTHPGTSAHDDVDVEIYAMSMGPGVGSVNDTFSPRLLIVAADGTERIEADCTLISTYANPPQSYNDVRNGSYPIIYRFAGSQFDKGDQIKKIIIINECANTTNFIHYGVNISGVSIAYDDGEPEILWEHGLDSGKGFAKLTRPGRPHIMLSRNPNRTENFEVWGRFDTTNLGIGSSVGLVGFVQDGLNYAFGRYRVTAANGNGVYEVGLVREGRTYTLGSWAGGWQNDTVLMFSHRDGRFTLQINTSGSSTWLKMVEVNSVTSTYGPVATSGEIMHTGLYGYINPPAVQVAPYSWQDVESEDEHSDGIGVLPGQVSAYDSFPSSGQLLIGDSIYSYTSRWTGAYRGRGSHGPFQARRTSAWLDGYAIDFLLFDYRRGAFDVAGYLMASDNGYTWEIDRSLWQVHEGSLLVRSRHYGENVYGNFVGSSNRIYLCEGFRGIYPISNPKSTKLADWAYLYRAEEITVWGFGAATGGQGANLQDLIGMACKMSNVIPAFADYYVATRALNGTTPVNLKASTDLSVHDFEISMVLPLLTVWGQFVGIRSDARFTLKGQQGSIIAIQNLNGHMSAVALNDALGVIEGIEGVDTLKSNVRFVFHGNYCSVYDGEAWMHTFMFDSVSRPAGQMQISLIANSGNVGPVTQVSLTELSHWRGSVPIEMSSTQNVLGSIIQERPILMAPRADGSVMFSHFSNLMSIHDPIPYALNGAWVREVHKVQAGDGHTCSDAVVFFEDVAVITDPLGASWRGFVTKLYSLGNIEEDEIILTTRVLQRTALEREERYVISMRPDLRVEVGDVVSVDLTFSGSGTIKSLGNMVVEGVAFAQNKMVLNCRRQLG
jgi:hypothetical protein